MDTEYIRRFNHLCVTEVNTKAIRLYSHNYLLLFFISTTCFALFWSAHKELIHLNGTFKRLISITFHSLQYLTLKCPAGFLSQA